MKILAIAVALVAFTVAETAVACPACSTRIGQPMAFGSPAPVQRHHHHLVRRPMAHHHAQPAYVPWAMPTRSSGCGGCGSGCGPSPYIARPCGCGSSMPSYAMGGCGSAGCGSVGHSSVGYGSMGYGSVGQGSMSGGIRRCVPVSTGVGGQTVMRCYRLMPVPKGTPGALTYQQVMNLTQGGSLGGYSSGYGATGYSPTGVGSGGYVAPY